MTAAETTPLLQMTKKNTTTDMSQTKTITDIENTIDADDLRLISIAETKDADSPAFESLITRCKSLTARLRIQRIFHDKFKRKHYNK